jgi:hypothetical protein
MHRLQMSQSKKVFACRADTFRIYFESTFTATPFLMVITQLHVCT